MQPHQSDARSFEMLIPNFLADARDRGYMESFMDWRLIYRDHVDMPPLADDTIAFLLVTKSAQAG